MKYLLAIITFPVFASIGLPSIDALQNDPIMENKRQILGSVGLTSIEDLKEPVRKTDPQKEKFVKNIKKEKETVQVEEIKIEEIKKEVEFQEVLSQIPMVEERGNGTKIFRRNIKYEKEIKKITLPSGSVALGTSLFGVQVSPNEEKPMLIELNYAWLGPNQAVVEMTDCRLWARVRSELNTERLVGKANKMTCRAENGSVFDVDVVAHIVNAEDEYLGLQAKLITPGKGLAATLLFLKDGVKMGAEAFAAAQVNNTTITGQMNPVINDKNVSGSHAAYAGASAVAGASGKFLDWFIDYYTNLAPNLAVGPSHKVFLAIETTVSIPSVFFKENINKPLDILRKIKDVKK